jgi:two-component system response regulator FixJ
MPQTIFIVDDDSGVRDSLRALLESAGHDVRDFDSARKVLGCAELAQACCLIADIRMPDIDGLALQEELSARKLGLPVIIMTGHGDVPLAVRAMKAGAVDFIEKPFDDELLLASVSRALALATESRNQAALAQTATDLVASLTSREREVLQHLVAGHPNKLIAYALGISPRTVEIHRANVMDKLRARSLSDVIRQALAAGLKPAKK